MDNKNKIKETLKAKLKQEITVTGTGASVTPGVNAGVAQKYAFGKRKNKGTPSDWKEAPSIPNRPSKAMDYKELWEEFKVGDKVTYLGHPAEITAVNKEPDGISYNVLYDKGTGKTKASNIWNKGGDEIKPLKEDTNTTYFDELKTTGNLTQDKYPDNKTKLPVYTLRDRQDGKQFVRFAYDEANDMYGIKQVGGYHLEANTLQKAGMKPTQTWTAGTRLFVTDGNYNPVFINIDLFKQIVDETMGGFSKYAKDFGDFYKNRGTTSGTIDENTTDLEAVKDKVIAWSKTLPKGTFDSWGDFEDNVRKATSKDQIRDAMIDANESQELDVTDKFDELGLEYDESEKSTDPLMKKSTTNSEELARVQGLLQRAHDEKSYSVMSSYEYRIKMLKILVALEKKYNTTLPLFEFHKTVLEYLREYFPGFTGKFGPYNQKWSLIAAHLEKALSEKQGMNEENLEEGIYIPDNIMRFAKRKGVIDIVKQVADWVGKANKRITGGTAIGKDYSTLVLDLTHQGGEIHINTDNDVIMVNGRRVRDYDGFVAALGNESVNEASQELDKDTLLKIYNAPKGAIKPSAKKEKNGYTIKYTDPKTGSLTTGFLSQVRIDKYLKGELKENIERDQKVKIVKGTHAGNTAIVHDFDSDKDTASGDDWVDVLIGDKKEKKTVKASELKPLTENYARFRNETKTRTKPEQFHSAVKSVKKKVQEINKLFEYMNRLQKELSESEGGLSNRKYTENALQQIKEATKALFLKSTKLK